MVGPGAGLVLLPAFALLSLSTGVQAASVAPRSSGCSISKVWHDLGPTYVEKLSVAGTSCRAGESLVTAYNRCRVRSGGLTGHCRARVDGFSCPETRYDSPDQFIAAVTCTRPHERVTFTYSEDV
jgi:hypothetical protein